MKLGQYIKLIKYLPVREQSFSTKRSTWKYAESNEWLVALNDRLFKNETITISRNDIFNTVDLRELIVKTIYWGYPRGIRGRQNFIKILNSIDSIALLLDELRQKESITNDDYLFTLVERINNIQGLGISTFSKLLYFCDIHFEGNPCLILDDRLVSVFSNCLFEELKPIKNINNRIKAQSKYPDYLLLFSRLSIELGVKGENIEQFLFLFGQHLKPDLIEIDDKTFTNIWNGYCPESFYKGKRVKMRLNSSDFYESEETQLQISPIAGTHAVILNFRGKGDFKSKIVYAHEVESGQYLSPQDSDRFPFNKSGRPFIHKEELKKYLSEVF